MRPTCQFSLVSCAVAGVVAALSAQPCSWSNVNVPGPAARHSQAMAYDAARKVTVLFGGFDGSPQTGSLLGDTWEFDGLAWRSVAHSGPSARLGAAMVYDSKRKVIVLFGGSDGAPCQDTWQWDGTTWKQVASTGPGARSRHAMAYDSVRGVTVLFGGMPRGGDETWEWDGSAWRQIVASGPWARARHALAYDVGRGLTTLYGGRDETNRLGDDTWQWDGLRWSQVVVSGPSARSRHAMVYDSARKVMVLFGGNAGPYLDDTWEWNGSAWSKIFSGVPSRRQYHAMVYDSTRRVAVLFGGWNGTSALGDTWEYASCQLPVPFGCETPHCSGAAQLSATSCPRVGNAQFAIQVTNAVPDQPGPAASIMVVSDTAVAGYSVPCTGSVAGRLCVNVVPRGVDFVVAIDARGQGALPVAVPNLAQLKGLRAYFQLLSYHPRRNCPCLWASILGLTSSKGLEVLVQ